MGQTWPKKLGRWTKRAALDPLFLARKQLCSANVMAKPPSTTKRSSEPTSSSLTQPRWGADERPGGRCPARAAKPSLRELLLGQPGDFTRALHLLRCQGGDRPFGGVGHGLLRFYHKASRALHRSSCAHFGVLVRSCLWQWFGRGESQQSIYEWHTVRQALETNSRITASNVSARELESITSCLCMGETLGIERQKRGQLSL